MASGRQPVTWAHGGQGLEVLRGRQPGILHLHGHYTLPDTVVFGNRSYEDIRRDAAVQNSLRSILTRDVVVFVGCGAGNDDPNIGRLFDWAREILREVTHTHFHLVRNSEQIELRARTQGLPITVVAYRPDYSDLGPFLENITRRVEGRRPTPPAVRLVPTQLDYHTQQQALAADVAVAATERVLRLFELGRALWHTGGRRSAAMDLAQVVLKHGLELPGDEHVRYALEAAGYALDDNLEFSAGQLLERAQPHVAACSAVLRSQFYAAQIRWHGAQGDTSRLLATVAEALGTATPADRSRLEAERDEVLLLEGELDGLTGERGDS